MIHLIFAAIYILIGVLKVKWFDRNDEGGWMHMLSDSRNTNWTWLSFIGLAVAWITWPIGLIFPGICFNEALFKIQWSLCVYLRQSDYYIDKHRRERERNLKMILKTPKRSS